MRRTIAGICLLLSIYAMPTAASGIHPDGYTLYEGDINNDGIADLYFEYKPPIIILHGDIATPVQMPKLPNFAMYGEITYAGPIPPNSDYYPIRASYGSPVETTLTANQLSTLALLSDTRSHAGDFNGDGARDLLVYAKSPSTSTYSQYVPLIVLANGNDLPTAGQQFATQIPFPSNSFQLSETELALVGASPSSISVRDINNDGRDDIVIAGTNGTANLALAASSNGTFDAPGEAIAPRVANMAGASGGQFRVNESGAATYSISIATAAGTAGVAPEVSLGYSGNGGNGIAGKGWSIGGLSGISRCRQTLAIDGKVASITFTKDDRFCLDGQRLLKVTGSEYGAVGAVYKTELDSFVKAISVGGSLGKPASFKVERKDGSISEYGNTADSRQLAGTETLTWMQNEFADSVGNRIEYQYEGDASSGHRIKQIRYAYGSGSSAAQIDFSYAIRPDYLRGYTAGYEFKTTQRLAKITSRSDGSIVREYTLGYMPTPLGVNPDKTSLLANVQECVSSSCLPAISFDWLQPGITYPTVGTETTDFSPSSGRFLVNHLYADFNGDGKQDIVWIEGDNDETDTDTRVKYAISSGGKYVKQSFIAGKFTGHYFTGTDVDEDFRLRVLDYNGDGRHDIAIFNERAAYGALANRWTIFLSRYSGGAWKLDSNPIYTSLSDKDAIFADFNSDGLADYISVVGGYVKVRLLQTYGAATSSDNYYRFSTSELSYSLTVPGATLGTPKKRVPDSLGDFNGDGAMDLLVATYSQQWGCKPTGGGGGGGGQIPAFLPRMLQGGPGSCGTGYYWDVIGTFYDGHRVAVFDQATGNFKAMALLSNSKIDREPIAADINGDGLTDVGYVSGTTFRVRLSTGTGLVEIDSQGSAEKASLADINSDGYPDIYWQATDGYLKVRYFNPAGNSFGSAQNFLYVGTSDKNNNWFADVDGDGQADFHKYDGSSGKLYTYLANKDVPADKNQPRNVISSIDNGLGNITKITYDNMVGGGVYTRLGMSTSTQMQCFIEREPGSPNYGEKYCYPVTVGDPSDLYEALNGPWDLPEGMDTLGKDKPVLDILAPMFLVKKVESTAPAASATPGSVNHSAMSSVTYHYHQMKLQAAGRGMLGFQKVTSTDNQTNVKTETIYRQDFPFTGMPLLTETKTAAGHVLSRAVNTWDLKDWTCASSATKACQPYIKKAEEETYDLKANGAEEGSLLQTVVTENTYDSYGNAEAITVTSTDAATGSSFVKRTANCYGGTMAAHPNTSCSGGTTWDKEKGRLSFSRVVNTRPGMASHVRESSFTYYTSGTLRGLLRTEVIEPNKPAYTQTTTYDYDPFGNVKKKILSAVGEQSRYTRTEYDAAGRYAQKNYNSLEHLTEEVISRNHFGAPEQVNGMNGLVTWFSYDGLGRETYRYDNTGADARTRYLRCTSGCPTGAKYKVVKSSSTGASGTEYFDALGRVMRTEAQGFSKTIYADKEYDNLGRVRFVSEPWFSGNSRVWTKTEYDLLGRPTGIIAPDGSDAVISYQGLKTVTTNDKGQKKTEIRNVAGELVEVIDDIDGRLTYEYDTQGNLHKAKSWGNGDIGANPITVTINYDDLGRKKDMSDPDKGFWKYEYTKYGELKKQTNGNGHTVEFTYDVLGRQKTRIDRKDGATVTANVTWTYDIAQNGLGQVQMVADSVSGYEAVYQYDELGRNDTQLVDFDGTGSQSPYTTVTQFDGYGRVLKVFDALDGLLPSGQSGTQNHYNGKGYLEKVTDLATGDLIHQTLEQTARGQLKRQLLGNGATSTFGYDFETGRLLSQISSVLGAFGIQKINYDWDTLGNLIYRYNQSGSKNLRESFCYDSLNRLIKTHIGSSNYDCATLTEAEQSVRYNSIGNITWKAGVGGYSYGSVSLRPHAVATVNGVSYSYDANGNMTSDGFDGGRSIDYTTFDMAERITKTSTGHVTEFKYGPDRSRYYRKDTGSGGTTETWYIGNVERIQKSSAPNEILWKRHLAGIAVYTVKTNLSYVVQPTTDKRFLYKDHLGSMDLITNKDTTEVELMSFDAWGQRRNAQNWTSLTLAQLYGFNHDRTTRGYTGHEMLDEVGLVHMNGRIYDPRIGRFLQADPFVQAASDTQMYNRYSYVRNNSLNAADPSGYFLDLLIAGVATSYIDAVISKPVYSVLANNPNLATLVQVAGTAVSAYFCGPCSIGFNAQFSKNLAYAQSSNFEKAMEAGAISGISSAAFYGVGNLGLTGASQVIAHGMVGGIMAELQGGKFGHGFASAGFTAMAGELGWTGPAGQGPTVDGVVVAAVVGGTASVITGGKFTNGAITGAFSYVLNRSLHEEGGGWLKHFFNEATVPETRIIGIAIGGDGGGDATNPHLKEAFKIKAKNTAVNAAVTTAEGVGLACDLAIIAQPELAPILGPIGMVADGVQVWLDGPENAIAPAASFAVGTLVPKWVPMSDRSVERLESTSSIVANQIVKGYSSD